MSSPNGAGEALTGARTTNGNEVSDAHDEEKDGYKHGPNGIDYRVIPPAERKLGGVAANGAADHTETNGHYQGPSFHGLEPWLLEIYIEEYKKQGIVKYIPAQ